MPKIYHAIHTNAYSQDEQGFRSFVVPALKLPAEQGQRLDQWLRGLAPVAGNDVAAGVAVDSFKVDGVVFACLAMVDPDFALDEHGRPGGFLVHAVLLPLEPGRPCGDFGSALLELRRSFERPPCDDLERLNVYLEQCREHSEVMPRPADLQWVLALGEAFWSHFFAVVTVKRKEVVWPADSSADFPMDFLRVSALLPPRLRLALRWSFELPAVPKNAVRIRLGSGSELGSVEKTSCEGTYWQWLKACVGRGEPELVYEVAESWDINSWERLEGAILDMAKQRTVPKPVFTELSQPVRPVAGPPPAGLHDLRAIEDSVKRYLDRRLEGFEPERERPRGGWYQRWRAEIWGVPMLVWLAFVTFRGGAGPVAPPAATQAVTTAPVTKPSAPAETVKQPEPEPPRPVLDAAMVAKILANPRDEWQGYVQSHTAEAIALMKAVASGEGLPAGTVTAGQEARFKSLAATIEKQSTLPKDDREPSLIGAFEYILKLEQQRKGKADLTGQVDGQLDRDEYPQGDVRAFLTEHHVGATEDFFKPWPPSVALQSLVTITWLERPNR